MRCLVIFLCFYTTGTTANEIRFRFEMEEFIYDSLKANHNESADLCLQKGAELATISNYRQLKYIERKIGSGSFWLLATRENETSDFEWKEGQPIPETWWGEKQPAGGLCAILVITPESSYFRSEFCTVIMQHLCSRAISSTNRQWIENQKKCFEYGSQRVNQEKGAQLCQQKGAQLATISNDNEFAFLKAKITGCWHWLSATRKNGNSDFKWKNGQPFEKQMWGPNQPESGLCMALDREPDKPLHIRSVNCSKEICYMCSKDIRWKKINRDSYNFDDLCGVEIMPNCEGEPCEELCGSNNDCDQFAKILNLCVNVKITPNKDRCVVNLRPNLELYRRTCDD